MPTWLRVFFTPFAVGSGFKGESSSYPYVPDVPGEGVGVPPYEPDDSGEYQDVPGSAVDPFAQGPYPSPSADLYTDVDWNALDPFSQGPISWEEAKDNKAAFVAWMMQQDVSQERAERSWDASQMSQGIANGAGPAVLGYGIGAALARVLASFAKAIGGLRGASGAAGEAGSASRAGTLTGGEARAWYNRTVEQINARGQPTRELAESVFNQRNALRQQARDLMADRAAAAELERKFPGRDFHYYVDKYTSQGYSGESLWRRIIEGARTTNRAVNQRFGLD